MILPVAARDEEWQSTTQESMFNFVRLSDGGIKRLNNARPESAVLCELAQKLVPNGPINWNEYSNHQKIREAISKVIPGMEEAESIEKTRKEFYVGGRTISLGRFNTPTRKAAFQVRPLPSQRQKEQLILTTVRSEGQFNTIIYEENDVYRGTNRRWCVMMSPLDMGNRGLQQGELITLISDHGRMESITLYAYKLALGCVMAYFPEANVLTGSAVDPRSKTPSFKATPVWIEKRQNA